MKLVHVLLLFVLFISGCSKDDKTYKGNSLVEFSQNTITKQILFTQTQNFIIPIKLQLSSKLVNPDGKIQIQEIGDNSAILGKHYTVSNYSITIVSDSIFAYFNVNIIPSAFFEGESVNVSFKIADVSEIKPSENYKTCKLILSKQSFIDVFVGKFTCKEPINQDMYITTFIAGPTSNTIKDLNFWNFPAEGQTLLYTFHKDSTRKVEIIEQDWLDKTGQQYKISGEGTFDYFGKITMNYTVSRADTVYEKGVHEFIPLK